MNDAAKTATKAWAMEFDQRHGHVRDTTHMRELIDREQFGGDSFRVAMVQMPIDLVVAALIHYSSSQIAQQKVREVSIIAGCEVTRREYWNKLDRVHHYVAGLQAALTIGRVSAVSLEPA